MYRERRYNDKKMDVVESVNDVKPATNDFLDPKVLASCAYQIILIV